MIFVKLAVLLWVAFLIVRFFVRANTTLEEKVAAAVGKKIKMTFGRWVLVIVFLLAIADSFVALIWFLFFR
jgi:hypothetical protein|nr:MAG TPA_asm: hypothetical protein [Caudoviricetes sp.]